MRMNVAFHKNDARFDVQFAQQPARFDTGFNNIQIVAERNVADLYAGSYEVTPEVDAQTLSTAKKLMTEDLTVKAIPFFDVSNNSGGRTVYIAKEV
jgi:hypothetical protein